MSPYREQYGSVVVRVINKSDSVRQRFPMLNPMLISWQNNQGDLSSETARRPVDLACHEVTMGNSGNDWEVKVKLTKSLFTTIVAIAMLVGTNVGSNADDSLSRLQDTGEANMAIWNQAPYSYRQPDGEMAGTEYEIAREIFRRLKINSVIAHTTEWGSLIPGLKAKRFDVIGAAMYIRPKRCDQVAFTDPHFQDYTGLIIAKGNPKGIKTYDDLRTNSDVIASATQGGVSEQILTAFGVPKERIKSFPGLPEQLEGLKSGRIDVVVLGSADAMVVARKESGLDALVFNTPPVIDGKPHIDYASFAFRLEDVTLFEAFNAELNKFIGSDAHKAILAKHGLSDQLIPTGGITAKELCQE